ncbi:MAG: hypothetical protein OER04_16705 [Cyclobacteriaceae bacterium]|nr:hypothetical protein [Cyclobacteriaceae bacterium]
MKKLLSIMVLFPMAFLVYGQDHQETHMYESIYLTPKLDAISKLSENMAAHNKKYHGEGDHAAFVQNVVAGKRSGQMVWVMGPGTYAHLDSRPAEGGHDEDWANNVLPYLEKMSNIEYWRRTSQYYVPEGYDADKIRIRFYKVKRGQNEDFVAHYGKLVQVFNEKKYDRQLSIFQSTFPSATGRNMASVTSFDNWADLDKGLPVGKDFDSIHGEGSWAKWLQELQDLTEWSDQEVRELMPEMSGTLVVDVD